MLVAAATISPEGILERLLGWDDKLTDMLSKLLEGELHVHEDSSVHVWVAQIQVGFPGWMGGFGISRAVELAPLSYACSWLSCIQQPLMEGVCRNRRSVFHREPFLESNLIPRPREAALDAMAFLPADVAIHLPTLTSTMAVRSKDIYNSAATALAVYRLTQCKLLFANDQAHLGLLASLGEKHAGAWVQALPTTQFLTMSARE